MFKQLFDCVQQRLLLGREAPLDREDIAELCHELQQSNAMVSEIDRKEPNAAEPQPNNLATKERIDRKEFWASFFAFLACSP